MANLQEKIIYFDERDCLDPMRIAPDNGFDGIKTLEVQSGWDYYIPSCGYAYPQDAESVSNAPPKDNCLWFIEFDDSFVTNFLIPGDGRGVAALREPRTFYPLCRHNKGTGFFAVHTYYDTWVDYLAFPYGDTTPWKLSGAYSAKQYPEVFDVFYDHCLCADECACVLRFDSCSTAWTTLSPIRTYSAYFANQAQDPGCFYLLGIRANNNHDRGRLHLDALQAAEVFQDSVAEADMIC